MRLKKKYKPCGSAAKKRQRFSSKYEGEIHDGKSRYELHRQAEKLSMDLFQVSYPSEKILTHQRAS